MSIEAHLSIRPADRTDSHTISTLAHAIWPGTYGGILSEPQIHYMLHLFYSEEALHRQIDGDHFFYLAEISSEPVGFVAFSHDDAVGVFKIHKLYVHPMVQGKGVGRKLMDTVIEQVKQKNASMIRLNVNRLNPALSFYKKIGFTIAGEEDIAIGEGYFMTDFMMEKKI